MTTYGRLLRTIIALRGTIADLKLIALNNPQQKAKDEIDEAAAALGAIVQGLEERRQEMTAAEPQYRLGVKP